MRWPCSTGAHLYGDPADREAIFVELGRGGRIDGRELVMRKSTGEPFTSVLTARGIEYEGSEAAVMSYLDVNDLKRAEAALRASEQRFRGIAEAHPMPLVIVRQRDGRLVFANEPFRALFRLGGISLDGATPEQFYADAGGARALPRGDAGGRRRRGPGAEPAPAWTAPPSPPPRPRA